MQLSVGLTDQHRPLDQLILIDTFEKSQLNKND